MLEMSSCESSSEEDQIVLKKRTKIVSNVLSESEAEDQMESSDDETETSSDLQSSILNKQEQDNVKNEDFKAFKRNLSRMVDEHKMSLKKLRQEERANDEEFFALVTYQKTGELPSADNTTVYLPVMHEGINLMLPVAVLPSLGVTWDAQCMVRASNASCNHSSLGLIGVAKTFELRCLKMNVQSLNLLCEENIPNSRKQHTKTLAMQLIKWAWILNSNFSEVQLFVNVLPVQR